MSGFDPKGESVRRAVRWIGERRKADPGARLADLLTEAGLKFDLSPDDQEKLFAALTAARRPPEDGD